MDAGEPKKKQMLYQNFVNECLLVDDNMNKLVLELINPPELHLMLGL